MSENECRSSFISGDVFLITPLILSFKIKSAHIPMTYLAVRLKSTANKVSLHKQAYYFLLNSAL